MTNWNGEERRKTSEEVIDRLYKVEEGLAILNSRWESEFGNRETQGNLYKNLNQCKFNSTKITDDHENRLRFLEKSIWVGFGGLAVLNLALKFLIK